MVNFELPAILSMAFPTTFESQALTRLRSQQVADDGEQLATGAASRDTRNRIAGLLVGIGDAFKDRFQRYEGDR